MVAMLGPEDMGVVLLVVLVVAIFTFGSNKIPQLARSLGQAKDEFKKGMNERPEDDQAPASAEPARDAPGGQP